MVHEMSNTEAPSARNTLTASDYALFRETARRFAEHEIKPNISEWEHQGIVPLEWWRSAGAAGLLCVEIDDSYGGAGGDFRSASLVVEEIMRVGAGGLGSCLTAR